MSTEHRMQIDRILRDPRYLQRDKWVSAWNYILATELGQGAQFLVAVPGNSLYIILGTTNEAVALPRRGGEKWHAYFAATYGLGETEAVARFLYDALRSHVLMNGARVEVRRFAAYNRVEHIAYLSGYNGELWRIDGADSIELAPNGTDNVFFVDDDGGQPIENVYVGPHGILIDRLTNINFAKESIGSMTPEHQQRAFIVWLFMLAFPDVMPTKPLLLLEGTQGSGKTSAVQMLQLALMGISRAMQLQRNKEDDFGVVLLRSPIAIFDNTDTHIDWVPDAICAYATDAVWNKRKLYTDDESMVIKPQAFIAVASKNPASFRREDVADRCIILRLERRESFKRMDALKEAIIADRPQLFGEYLWYIGQIVEEMRNGTFDAEASENHRMADYAAFARVVGKVLGWEADAVPELMLALQSERDAFTNEEDPLILLLHSWIKYPARFGPRNPGRSLTTTQLHAELESLALAGNIQFKHTPRTIKQKLRSPHILRDFKIQVENRDRQEFFKIWPIDQPALTVINGGDFEDESGMAPSPTGE